MRNLLLSLLVLLLSSGLLWSEEVVLERNDTLILVCTEDEMLDKGIQNPNDSAYFTRSTMHMALDENGNMHVIEHETIVILEGNEALALASLKKRFGVLHYQACAMLDVLRKNGIDPLPGGEVDDLPEVNSLAEVGQLKDWLAKWLPHGREWWGTITAMQLQDDLFEDQE